MLEEHTDILSRSDIGSEFRYRKPIVNKNTAAIFVSQSGETADTLASLREMKEKGIMCLGVLMWLDLLSPGKLMQECILVQDQNCGCLHKSFFRSTNNISHDYCLSRTTKKHVFV
jgi:glucosamine 6-phosphate synthetase-like amidotransferase/phosphosugar isomerase protein